MPGRIVTSEVHLSLVTEEGDPSYSADIEYVYTVEGFVHHSDVVAFGRNPYEAHEAVSRYPVGKTVSVSYEPGKARGPGTRCGRVSVGDIRDLPAARFATLFNFIICRAMGRNGTCWTRS